MSIPFLLFRILICIGVAVTMIWSDAGQADAGVVDGGSGPSGVTITIVQWDGPDIVHPQGPGVDGGCDYGLALGPPGFVPDLSTVGAQPPGAHLALLTCNGTAVGLTWVGPHNTVDLADAARDAARRWVETIPIPAPTIAMSPLGAGLVGLDTWLWSEGGPRPTISGQVEAFGVAVDVRMVSSPIAWSFGDGVTVIAGRGRPWPERSDVRHTYRQPTRAVVTTSQRVEPSYRVMGGGWLALSPIVVRAAQPYAVREAQAIVVE
jgi:hypothetical protein